MDFRAVHGVRPTAVETYQDGYNPRSVRERSGSWSQFVASMGDLTSEQQRALALHHGFGADAGASGTRHEVSLQLQDSEWHLSALGRRRGELTRGKATSPSR